MRSTSKRFDLWERSIKGIEEGKPYQERKKMTLEVEELWPYKCVPQINRQCKVKPQISFKTQSVYSRLR